MKRHLAAFYLVLAVLMLIGLKAQAAEGTVTTVRVLGTNGTVTAGLRTVTGPDTVVTGADGGVSTCANVRREFVYTTDGVHWSAGSYAGELRLVNELEYDPYASSAIWSSTDKLSWTKTELRQIMDAMRALG